MRQQVQRDAVAWSDVGDGVILLHLEDSAYMELNPTGAHLWHQLLDGATTDELVASLVDAFDIDEATARSDTESLLDELRSCGLVTG